MTLQPTMKRRLHERLHPLIGEEEADALLDEVSSPDPVTREWLETRFDRIDDRFERSEARTYDRDALDAKLEAMGTRIEVTEHRILTSVHRALTQQILWVYGAAGLMALIISVVDRIWG